MAKRSKQKAYNKRSRKSEKLSKSIKVKALINKKNNQLNHGDEFLLEIKALKLKLHEANFKYRQITQSHGELKKQFSEWKKSELTLEKYGFLSAEEEKNNEIARLKNKLNEANLKYRSVTQSYARLKTQNLKNNISLSEKQQQLTKLEKKLLQEKQQVIKVRNHLSYQLGNALITSGKSWRSLVALPGKLLKIRGEAKRRKLQKVGYIANEPEAKKKQQNSNKQAHHQRYMKSVQTAIELKKIKIACIMDTFTYESYAPEANFFQLTPKNWKSELEKIQPDMLFVESAWRGKDELWGNKVGHTSQELTGIVNWCKENKITSMFWNKEDPVHFETFLNTAKLFDHIFTTDIDCISSYKKALGHNYVYFLPFAAQPKIHNPIEKYQRKDKFCFAGAYYNKYPDRTKNLNNFVVSLPDFKDIEIYDRNFGKNDSDYMFPDAFQPFIVGTLPYDQIDKAYKGYNYAINLNSIKQSQSMFARRVYELLASNTITVSNFSHGLRLMFGDLVFTSDSGDEICRKLNYLTGDTLKLKQFRLLALRKVLSEHLYQDRLNYIHSKLSSSPLINVMPMIKVVAYADSVDKLECIRKNYSHQAYKDKSLTIIISGFKPSKKWAAQHSNIRLLSLAEAKLLKVNEWAKDSWLSTFNADDFYGEHYLTDLTLATRYTNHKVIGKKSYFSWANGLIKPKGEHEYCEVEGLTPRQSLFAADALPPISLKEWLIDCNTWEVKVPEFSIDSMNYCHGGYGVCENLPEFAPDKKVKTGLALADMQSTAEIMTPAAQDISSLKGIKAEGLEKLFKPGRESLCRTALVNDNLQIVSQLPDGKHEYWYSNRDFTPAELNAKNNKVSLYLETTPGLNLQIVVLFLDEKKERLGHTIFYANKNTSVELPFDLKFIRLGLRVYAAGSSEIRNLYLEDKPAVVPQKLGCGDYLILTNNYASYDDLYKNGFVHSRVKSYQKQGLKCDAFRFKPGSSINFHEFEGVDVVTGDKEVLSTQLINHRYKAILVHFLDAGMWEVLQHYISDTRIIVWCHGSDIQSYRRREFLYDTAEEKDRAKNVGSKRDKFWLSLLKNMPENLHMVFVSNYLKNCVEEDLNIALPKNQYSIIPNPINTELFKYVPKSLEQRKKILSIRPYASKVYANDLSVKAILELSKEPFFKELEFRLIGDGPLFDEILEPLQQFENVHIDKRFLTQTEISKIHKEYGVFLCPSRMDTQGVSRDEAMASGLVPLTNKVAAIPEFTSSNCAVLAEPESYHEIALGVKKLFSPELFEEMSLNASKFVKNKSSEDITMTEIGLFVAGF